MSLINTNFNYLDTMGIGIDSPLVGVIVSVYYLGCAAGAVFFSWLSDKLGRKSGIFFCLATASLGNVIMFIAGLGYTRGAFIVMVLGRVTMGLGVGGIDAVIPVYSSELADDEARGKALAQEFQMNIFGLNMAYAINLIVTVKLGKLNQWAWRIPIMAMQIYPVLLLTVVGTLPESPRWLMAQGKQEKANKASMIIADDEDEGTKKFDELLKSHEEASDKPVRYIDMITPGHAQFHPTIITIMVQINQALTGYGVVSVYGSQIFELLGFSVGPAEYLTQANFISYFLLVTFAWLLIDAVGRRRLMLSGSAILTICFTLLTLFAGLASNASNLGIPVLAPAIPGIITLFIATGAFGIGWLATVWLIPTEIYPTTARARASAISVIIWGLSNFAITLSTPLMFNHLGYWIFLVFAGTNLAAGAWTWVFLPESGNRSFEENVGFFEDAKAAGTWRVRKVEGGRYLKLPYGGLEDAERTPLLRRVEEQL